MKRLGRYLQQQPRLVYKYPWQDISHVDVYSDTDWAGCVRTRKSTSGGISFIGGHAIKSWSTNQNIIALSSAEAELYALLKGASQSLGWQSMANDFGDNLSIGLYSDASAAIAISQRTGLGKLRHIQTQYLWLQERVSRKDLSLTKVVGTANPADMLTKAVDSNTLNTHLQYSGLAVQQGRADGALDVG